MAIAVLLVIGAAALGALLVSQEGQKVHNAAATADRRRLPRAKTPTCETRLLRDWSDGRIDGVYPVSCYRAALRSLPADLEVYSSAHDDIAQALSQRIVLSHHPQKISGHQGADFPAEGRIRAVDRSWRSSSMRPARWRSRKVKPPR